ncbi:HSP90 family protein [Limnoglobus roseus]|uniref:HSP90 family protein n=1 Tax=Limnoglobus roseus TaxID=2598579 RepID=A0A5C1A8Z9_9BACT|nr:HSP90 family protein [Limnoglobus roseus]QEL14683.1 HSP90 family protein [Limnoglobus roseus]
MEHKFQINLRGIIDLLSEHIYSSPEVYVRELLQNAVDAITARGHVEPDHVGDIQMECHLPKGKPPMLVVTDNGIGLTIDEVHTFLSTIGLSSKKGGEQTRSGDFIGQFGIGILSSFVVSEDIVVITKSAKEPTAKPVEWRAKGDGTYTVKELDRDFEPGTQVWLTAKPGREDLFQPDRVKMLARNYGGLLPYPIRLIVGKTVDVINEGGAPWRDRFANEKDRQKVLLAYGREMFGIDFFDAVPIRSEVGKLDGVAFILPFTPAANTRRKHRVYLKNMFLSDAVENLLPDWAFFVQVVVNANDLRPTASRESFYEDSKLAKTRIAIGDSLRKYLIDLAEKRPEKMRRFIAVHHRAIKGLAVEDDEVCRLFLDWLPFETSLGEMTFGDYRQATDRVRYVPNVDAFRQIARVAAAQNLPVINAGYLHDAELLAKVPDVFPHLTVESVDSTTVTQDFDDLTDAELDAVHDFLATAEQILRPFRCSAEAKRFKPAELPALYSTNNEGRFFRSLEQSREVANPLWSGVLDNMSRRDKASLTTAQFCFNFNNSLVQKLATVKDAKKLTRAVQMLYVQALLLGHHPLSAKELAILNDGLLGMVDDSL